MKLSNEAKIGILVTAVLVALVVITIKSGDFSFSQQGYDLKVYFKNIDGVDDNAPVRLNGMEVGLVKEMRIVYGDDTRMELDIRIFGDTKIHEGAKAFVKNLGLFGEKYIGLTIGDTSKGYIKPGGVIIGEEPPNWDNMMRDGEIIAANLKEISVEVNERLKVNSESIDEILANFRKTSKNLASITDNVNERLEVNKTLIDDTVGHFNSASANLDEMSYDLKENPWKLLYKEQERREKKKK